MLEETLEEYALDSAEEAYKNPGEQAPMGIMALGGGILVSENTSPWMDQKHSSLPHPTGTNNNRWENVAI